MFKLPHPPYAIMAHILGKRLEISDAYVYFTLQRDKMGQIFQRQIKHTSSFSEKLAVAMEQRRGKKQSSELGKRLKAMKL